MSQAIDYIFPTHNTYICISRNVGGWLFNVIYDRSLKLLLSAISSDWGIYNLCSGQSASHAIVSKTSCQLKKELMASLWSLVGWSYPSVGTAFTIASFTSFLDEKRLLYFFFSIP